MTTNLELMANGLKQLTLPNEQWKAIDNRYAISSLGRLVTFASNSRTVFNYLNPKIMKPALNQGYLKTVVNGKTVKIHRLVAIHFIPNPNNYPQINHKNGIKHDNTVENLEWCTSIENSKHALEIGLTKIQYGSETPNSKLTEKDVIEIRRLRDTTNMTNTEIGKLFGVNQPAIFKIIHRKTWKHI